MGIGVTRYKRMLLHQTVLPERPFPLIELFYIFALRQNSKLVGELCRSVGFFFLAHELGHRHSLEHGTSYLRARIITPNEADTHRDEIQDLRLHEDGAIYNILVDGKQRPILLFKVGQSRWLEECYADVFACYLLVAKNQRPEDGLNSLANHLCIWQQILQVANLRQLREDRSPNHKLSHLPSTIRIAELHVNKFSGQGTFCGAKYNPE